MASFGEKTYRLKKKLDIYRRIDSKKEKIRYIPHGWYTNTSCIS